MTFAAFCKYAYLAAYSLLCLFLVGICAIATSEAIHVFTMDTDRLQTDYPFGSEQGFHYTSKEIYFYSVMTDASIAAIGFLLSITLFVHQRKTLSIAAAILTIGLLYGLYYLGDAFFSKAG